jgi:hypothetical protein
MDLRHRPPVGPLGPTPAVRTAATAAVADITMNQVNAFRGGPARDVRDRRATACMQALEGRQLMSAAPALGDVFGTVRADGNDLVADAAGNLHRVWRDRDTHALYYAMRAPDHTWTAPALVEAIPVGGQMSLAINPLTGVPAVAYYERVSANLKFASRGTGVWTTTHVDMVGDVGEFASLVINSLGKPYISYYDRTNGDLKWAFQFGANNGWGYATIDGGGTSGPNVGGYSALTEGPRRSLVVAYSDNTNGAIKAAALANGGTVWSVGVIDSGMGGGVTDIELKPGVAGIPVVAYRDVQFRRLKVAVQNTISDWIRWDLPALSDTGGFASLYTINGSPTVLHLNRASGAVETIIAGTTDIVPEQYLAMGGEHLNAVHVGGQLYYNRVDPTTGKLRTSATRFVHQYSNDAAQRVIHWETIGGSGSDDAKRQVGWSLDTIGWQGYVNGRVARLRALGMKRLFLHNPFGVLPNEDFQFDQFIHAQDAGLTWLTNGFASAFRPLMEAGIEVICYIGSTSRDPDFSTLGIRDYLARVKRSVQPLIDAGCSIGLDNIVGQDRNSRDYMVAEMLRQNGVKVFNENRPPAVYDHWHNFNGVYHDDGWLQTQPHINPELHWTAPNSMLTGEISRFTAHAPAGYSYFQSGWRAAAVMRIIRDGHTALTDLPILRSEGYTLSQLMPRTTKEGFPVEPGGLMPPLASASPARGATAGVLDGSSPDAGSLFGITPIAAVYA